MPGPYQVLDARVKQKIDTEANWIAQEPTFGVIFEGEQAFVKNDAGDPVNFKIGDGTKTFSQLPYFIAYYSNVTSQKVLSYINQNIDITVSSTFKLFSEIQTIAIYNNSGSDINLKIGTTPGGNDICEVTIPVGPVALGLKNLPTAAETLYLSGLAGHNYTLFILYFQYDEVPVTPPAGGSFKYPKGHLGMYYPVSPTDFANDWDIITGRGRGGTAYSNCALAGTNGLPDMGGKFPIGYVNGDTIGDSKGNPNNEILITQAGLPAARVPMFYAQYGSDDSGVLSDDAARAARNEPGQPLSYDICKAFATSAQIADPTNYVGKTGPIGGGQATDITPDAVVVLYFVAIS